jgi:D-alanyl-D-alanine carboxypeptidase
MKNFLLSVCLASCTLFAGSQNFNRAKMDSLFQLLNNNDKIMTSVSIFHDGMEVYRNAIGFADIASHMKANSGLKLPVLKSSFTLNKTN